MCISRRLIAFLALVVAPLASAETITGRVVRIQDGDTVTVLDAGKVQHKVRLAGIDAPERAQPFGQVSRRHLSSLVHGKDVELDCGKVDKYRREVCVVLLDGEDVNRQQVSAGLAWWYKKYADEQSPRQREEYEAAEVDAKNARRGLWQDSEPTPPWEWRRNKRSKARSASKTQVPPLFEAR